MSTGLPGFNVSEKYKYLWYGPERTGSRGVARILCFYGFKFKDINQNSFNKNIDDTYFRNYTHLYYQDRKYSEYKVICNTRNPYSRALSLYKNFANKGTFKDYIHNIKNDETGIINIIKNPQLQKQPDYVIRLEHFGEDIKKLPFIYDVLTEKQLDDMTISGKEIDEWESFYDSDMKEIVYNLCEHQFDIFGYEK